MRFAWFWTVAVGCAALLLSARGADRAREKVVDRPLSPSAAARSMVVPPGFHVTLFAGEPQVRQPIGFCIDDRGRLWVAEAYNYPKHGNKPGDRIIILEDTNGDGQHDKRTIFHDRLNYVTGIEVGFGGAWVMSPPYFCFIPDRDGDDQPDGPAEVVLDGFGNHANPHNLANGFAWGPDGWLYGTHGRTNWSRIGTPGTSKDKRTVFDGGVWRFHPTRRVWEAYADGTTNPWGIDWNEYGDAFVCNCVTPHLYHVIQGAHYEPWRNRASSRYAYQRVPAIADHLHFVGQGNVREGLFSPAEDAAGGGHAHCGSLIYLGDNWPASYRNTFFTCNIHGKRVNNDVPRRVGSGYIASHAPDLLRSADPWFTGVTLRTGPDGAVFVSDWSDTGECHHYTKTQRDTGRIFKISYGNLRTAAVSVARLSQEPLVELHRHPNDWFARTARRVLQERAGRGESLTVAESGLRDIFNTAVNLPLKLRAFWTLLALDKWKENELLALLEHNNEYLRAWAIRALCDRGPPGTHACEHLAERAQRENSPYARLALASALQRIPFSTRWRVAEELLRHGEDATDANLPLMYWYGIEPLINVDNTRFVGLASRTRIPLISRHVARRILEHRDADVGLTRLLKDIPQEVPSTIIAVLQGILDGLEGRRSVPMPECWPNTYRSLRASASNEVKELALQLALVFNDPNALAEQRQIALDQRMEPESRRRALAALVRKHVPDLPPLLLSFVHDPALQSVAIRALAEYDHPDTPLVLLAMYPRLTPAARLDVVQTLSGRPLWAKKLLEALAAGTIVRGDVTAYTARQIHDLGDRALRKQLSDLWGEVRPTPAAKAKQIRDVKLLLTRDALAAADRAKGRGIFQKTCANCHRFFDAGGNIGPDITGSQRMNLDYLLQTLIDPSAEVAKDYQLELIQTNDGRVVSGIVVNETEKAITVQSVNERLVIPTAELAARKISPLSMMPEGMLQNLTAEQTRQLFAYLMSSQQIALPDMP